MTYSSVTLLGHGALGAMVNTIETPTVVLSKPELEISFELEREEPLLSQKSLVPAPNSEPQIVAPPDIAEVQPKVQREVTQGKSRTTENKRG